MNLPVPRIVQTDRIPMSVYEAGDGPAVVLLHGFPELAYSWRHQIGPLADAGWHVIAPDLRGYGGTGPHGALKDYSFRNLSLDVLGLLDALAIDRAVLIGHDFGGALAWTMARDHPVRVAGIVSLNTPYTRRTARDLALTMQRYRGDTNYMVVFQTPGIGEAILERDIAATFAGLMRRPAKTLEEFRNSSPSLQALPVSIFTGEPEMMGDPIMSGEERQVYVDAFTRTGFGGPLNWYRNLHQNWLDSEGTVEEIKMPALMISAADDFLLPPDTTRGMEAYIPDLERQLIADCGHWTQQEKPVETNAILIEWLDRNIL